MECGLPSRRARYPLAGMKRTPLRGLYSPELLESRIAPATFLVTTLADAGAGSLRDAVGLANAAASADTITFSPALFPGGAPGIITLTTGEIPITDTIKITGPGIDLLTISGNNASRIFKIADSNNAVLHPATISGITFRDGNAVDSGGALYSSETVTLTNCVFFSNTAGSSGGGVYVGTKGKVTIASSRFIDNDSGNEGGGLAASAEGPIVVSRSIASGNTATGGGGGFYLYGRGSKASTIKVDGCTLVNNSATGTSHGGGLLIDFDDETGKVSVLNTIVSGNSGTRGGGLYLDGGRLTMSKSTFTQNTAALGGGAILASNPGTLVIKSSRFEKNSAANGGGALYLRGTDTVATITGSAFVANTAATGGAILGADDVDIIVKTSTFAGNTATGNGGAISLADGGTSLLLAASTVSGNAGVNGGGIFANTGAKITVTGGVFSGNSSTSEGGGIYTEGSGSDAVALSVTGTLFQGNRTDGVGGAIFADGSGTILIKGAKVIGNEAGDAGGGMYLRSTTSTTVLSSLFQHNVSGGAGGGLVLDPDTATAVAIVTGCKFLDNFADGDGGGIVVFGDSILATTTIKNTVISGNIALVEGGGLRRFPTGSPVTIIGPVPTGNWAPLGPNVFP